MKNKIRVISLLLATSIGLTACNPMSIFKKDTKQEENTQTEVDKGIKSVKKDELKENQFYVKNGDQFYSSYIGYTTIEEDNLIATELDESRVISYTDDDEMVPILYKDDVLVYYTTGNIPAFTFERYRDNGYSVGLYNLESTESGKVQFILGESKTDHNSAAYKGLSELDLNNTNPIIDKVGGRNITGDMLSKCGSITGLKVNAGANIDLYIGTQHKQIQSTVDTHILSAMELYPGIEDYTLTTEGYAIVNIPDYFLSGYYLINGIGMIKYVANNRNEGMVNVDFNTPYFYKDENGKTITKAEYDKAKGNESEENKEEPSNTYTLNIDNTQKAYNMKISYELKGTEDPESLSYKKPRAEIISPDGKTTDFELESNTKEESLNLRLDSMKSGEWKINVYNLSGYDLNIVENVESGNADSFIHSGDNAEGTLGIYTDGISGNSYINVTWENSAQAVDEATITSPAGAVYKFVRGTDEGSFNTTYGSLVLPLDSIEPGTWTLKVRGSNLGRVWMNFDHSIEAVNAETEEQTETEVTEVNE